MTDLAERVDAFVETHRDDLIAVLCELVAARTENPPGNEHLAADVLERWFDRFGIPHRRHEKAPGRTNIIGTVGTRRPAVLIAGHLDVVPAGDGWETDPFEAVLKDGYIYGRGTCDNKGATAAMVVAGAFLKTIEDDLPGSVWLAGVAEEETGSSLGLECLATEGLLDIDCAIVPDVPKALRLIDIAEKGVVFYEVTSRGRQAHGSRPQDGVNAIWNLIDFLQRLRATDIPCTPHPHLTPPTVNVGQINGGSAPNMVPATCTVMIDIRYLPGTNESDIRRLLDGLLAETAEANGGRFDIRPVSSLPPTEVAEDSPLVRALAEASEAVLGEPVRISGLGGATVVKQLLDVGIPAVGCGLGEENQAHVANERVAVRELVDLTRILPRACVQIMRDWTAQAMCL